ncbi:MAG: leucine-rich repeat domain-containing protein [Treponema sp.]|nr:leucine-rich repeat domain-containing protein [Treponema sp.]
MVKRYQTAVVMSAAGLKYEGYEFGGWKPDLDKPELYMPGTEKGKKLNGDPWPENLGGSITARGTNITLYDVWNKIVDPRKLAGIWKVIAKDGNAATAGYFAFNGFKYGFWPDQNKAPELETSLVKEYTADGEKVSSGGAELFRYAQDRDENGLDILIVTMKDGPEYRCRRDAGQLYAFTPGATEADGVTITAYAPQESSSSLALPAQILGLKVTAIYTRAFFQQTALDSVVIPAGVTTIGDEAFSGCGLKSVTIPDTVTLIGARAFQGHQFTAIAIPAGLKDMAAYPDGTDADGKAAAYPPGILGVTLLPAGVTQPAPGTAYTRFFPGIGAYAFADSGLPAASGNTATLTFHNGVSPYSIGESAFARAKIGGELTLPAGIRDFVVEARDPSPGQTFPGIGANAFDAFKTGYNPQNSISALRFAAGIALKTIGNGAFRRNTILDPPSFPSSLVKLGEIIPGSATAPAGAFEGNPISGTLTIPGTVKEIGPYAFANPYAYVGDAFKGGIMALTLEEGIERIGDGAFSIDAGRPGAISAIDTGKGKLVGLIVPASLKSIGRNAFMDNKIAVLDLSGAVGLESIGAGAFSRNSIAKLANLPPKLAVLGDGAFRQNFFGGVDNDGRGIDLSTAAGITEIGASVFGSSSQLKAVAIPEGVKVIRKSAFSGSSKLAELDLPSTLERIEGAVTGEGAFFNTALTRITIRSAASAPIALPVLDMLFGAYDKNGAFRSFYAVNHQPGVYEWRTWEAGDLPESDAQKAVVKWRYKPLPP